MAGFCGAPRSTGRTGSTGMNTFKKSASQTAQAYDFLLPERNPRPKPFVTARPLDIEDAVFEVVAARQRPDRTNDNPRPGIKRRRIQILPIAARFGGRLVARIERRLASLSPQAFVTLLSALFIGVFWLCGGFSALGAQSSSSVQAYVPYELTDTVIAVEDANGMKIAAVTGAVINTSPTTIDAPAFRVVTGSRQEQLGVVTLPVTEIGPNMTIRFSGRFKLAGGKSADIAFIPERS